MSLPIRVSTAFLRKNPLLKIKAGQLITSGLAAEVSTFSNLPVPLTELESENFKFQTAEKAASGGDKTAIAALKIVESGWISRYRETADYVSMRANGNAELIRKAGFVPTKGERKKKTVPPMMSNLKAAPGGGKGVCAVSCTSSKDISGYLVVAAPEEVTVAMVGDAIELTLNGIKMYVKPTSRRITQLTNLASKQSVCVSMIGYNAAGTGPLTSSIEVTPQ